MTTKKRLIKRLQWYYPTEKFNAFLFSGIIVYVLVAYPLSDIILLLFGLLLITIILFQGQYYWKLKLHRLSGRSIDQQKHLKKFRKSQKFNMIMIGMIPFILLLQLFLKEWNINYSELFYLGLSANIIGILEHINYYHRQLMIDNIYDVKYLIRNRKLKIASLRKDLNENVI